MPITTISEGVHKLFASHNEKCPPFTLKFGELFDTVSKDGSDIPVFRYKYYNKFIGMHDLDLLGTPCALTVTSIDTEPVERILFRELYVAEYLLNSEVENITAYRNKNSANLIVGFRNKAKAHMQIHSAVCGEPQFRHELFTTEGFVSDRVVDTVTVQHALNVYTEKGCETYTDADMSLYGLTTVEQEYVYAIYDIFNDENTEPLIAAAKRLEEATVSALNNGTYHNGRES